MTMTISIIKTDWQHQQHALKHIREEVFMREQNISAADEWDELDATASHYLVFDKIQAIACARMITSQQQGKIGRVAVLAAFRRQHIATKLLQFIVDDAKQSGLGFLNLDAQTTVIGLYQHLGFQAYGHTFIDAGIIHQKMSLSL